MSGHLKAGVEVRGQRAGSPMSGGFPVARHSQFRPVLMGQFFCGVVWSILWPLVQYKATVTNTGDILPE